VNDISLYAKQQQLAFAAHGPGQYIRDSGECAVCHTHQGFLERMDTGEWAYSAGRVDDAAPMNCRTCHMIHTTFTAADYAFTADQPVQFRVADVTYDFSVDTENANNNSNLCAQCHQSRLRDGQMAVIDGPDVTFTSTHYGPHGSTQGDMAAGIGFYDFEGTNDGGAHAHQTDARTSGCTTCHMADGSLYAGGHTFDMGNNTTGCEVCHTDVEDFDKFGGQTAVQGMLDELGVLLEASGAAHYDAVDGEWHPVPGTYPANTVAALWNFFGVINDGSLGVHNPPYIKGLLRGSIDAMTP
jgi:Zn-finger protein